MTDRERIVELGRAGFSKETIAAILGLELEDVVAVRAGRPSETAGRPGQVSWTPDVEIFDPLPPRLYASLVAGTVEDNNALRYTALEAGAAGELIGVSYQGQGNPNSSLDVSVNDGLISVTMETDGDAVFITTAAEALAALLAESDVTDLVTVEAVEGSTGAGVMPVNAGFGALAGGREYVSADRVEFEVVTGGVWFAIAVLAAAVGEQNECGADVLVDGESAAMLGPDHTPVAFTFGPSAGASLEEVLDPGFVWTMLGSFGASGVFDYQTAGPTLAEVGVFGEGQLHGLNTLLVLPNGRHSLEVVYSVPDGTQLALAKRRLQVWP